MLEEQLAVKILVVVFTAILTRSISSFFSNRKLEKTEDKITRLGAEIRGDFKEVSDNVLKLLERESAHGDRLTQIERNQTELYNITRRLDRGLARVSPQKVDDGE